MGALDEAKGKLKEAVGDLSGTKGLRQEGRKRASARDRRPSPRAGR